MKNNPLLECLYASCHEAIRKIQIDNNEKNIVPTWEECSPENKSETIDSVQFLIRTGASCGALHAHWMLQKKKAGWKYGKVKCSAQKTHPDMIPYWKLSKVAKQKDKVFVDFVKAFKPYL